MSKFCSEFLKVWPGYVYWARGQLKLAANAFINSIKLLSHGKPTPRNMLTAIMIMMMHFIVRSQ